MPEFCKGYRRDTGYVKKAQKHTRKKSEQPKRVGKPNFGSGRGKCGWYKGISCDSSWELAYVIWAIDQGIPIRRSERVFEYTKKTGELGHYYPDFEVEGNLVEVKGPRDPHWREKKACVDEPLEVIDKRKIKFYITYVKDTYHVEKVEDMYEKGYCLACGIPLSPSNKSGYCRQHSWKGRKK